jgi:glutamate racemase
LVLGCTHYPLLARTIGDAMGRDVVLVSSADETAFAVRALLERNRAMPHRAGTAGSLNTGVARIYKASRGKGGKTYAHWQISLAYFSP